jgi:hypothetical protein
MKTNKKYKICDYNHYPDEYSYINIDSTDPANGWVTNVPMSEKELAKFEEKPTPIKYFSSKSEAKEYLDIIRKYRNDDWEKNQIYYKIKGYKKPQWKIYEEK